jgi:LysM repeat protein
MKSKVAVSLCIGIVAVSLISMGTAGCTRGKSELPTPTLVAAVSTPLPTASGPTATVVLTPQAPPTSITIPAGPTAVVASASPSPFPFATATPNPTATPGQFEYSVQWGDTLFSLAQRFNTTVEAIVAANGLQDADYIKTAQVLIIPSSQAQPAPGTGNEYTVQAGDTLFSLARRYGTTVEAIQLANGIVNPWYINVGQKLIIPAGSTEPQPPPGDNTYIVQAGDTLYSIAARYGKNVWDVIVANNLSDPYWIYPGQVLAIP